MPAGRGRGRTKRSGPPPWRTPGPGNRTGRRAVNWCNSPCSRTACPGMSSSWSRGPILRVLELVTGRVGNGAPTSTPRCPAPGARPVAPRAAEAWVPTPQPGQVSQVRSWGYTETPRARNRATIELAVVHGERVDLQRVPQPPKVGPAAIRLQPAHVSFRPGRRIQLPAIDIESMDLIAAFLPALRVAQQGPLLPVERPDTRRVQHTRVQLAIVDSQGCA